MQNLMLMLLVGIIALAPAIAAAQVSSGAPGSTRPNSPLQGSGGPGTRPDSSGSVTNPPAASSEPSGATTTPKASRNSSTSPSASPSSDTSRDFSQYKNRDDCVNAGGMWHDEERPAASKCEAK
jgi:predicted lipid-binding transport protein (Tim44 family)